MNQNCINLQITEQFVVNADKTLEQINTAEELINLVEKYIDSK